MDGVLVFDAPVGSPAYKAGLRGVAQTRHIADVNVIVGFNNQPVKTEADLFDALDQCRVGETVCFCLWGEPPPPKKNGVYFWFLG